MNKLFTKILLGVFAVFLFAGTSFAASTSIRLEQPKSPTGMDTFNITFVALDTNSSQPVSVQCFKKGPSDGGFSSFGSQINLSNGGNTDNCQVTSGVMNEGNGTYQFYAKVVTGSTTPQSSTVNVDYDNTTPGTPTNYSKERVTDCIYRIHFRTADDGGKTVKVNLYRSENLSFNVDAGDQVGSLNIGSNTDGVIENNVPDCNKTWYFAIRAFASNGNGSGVGGDSQTQTTTTTVNPTTQTNGQGGAIPVGNGGTGGGSVLGSQTGGGNINVGGSVLGTESSKTKNNPGLEENTNNGNVSNNPVAGVTAWVLGHKTVSLLILILLGGAAYYLYRRFRK